MAIILILGNVGSGKTISLVRKAVLESNYLPTYTNIKFNVKELKKIGISNPKNIMALKTSDIVKQTIVSKTEKKSGEVKEKYAYNFNIDFWEKQPRPLNIYIDEAGLLVKARKSMSHMNTVFQDFLAMSRKISTDANKAGDLCLTAQTLGLIDSYCRQMAHQIRYCIMKYTKYCEKCMHYWREHSEMPEPAKQCPMCGNFDLKKTNFTMEERRFRSTPGTNALYWFDQWRVSLNDDIPYKTSKIHHCERYFSLYNTFQLKDMFTDYSTPKEKIFMK